MRIQMPTRLITLPVVLLVALTMPAAATASGDDVIRDCAQDGDLDKEYSDEELQDASENMPSDIDSYTDCRDVIRQAQGGGRGSTSSAGDPGGGGTGGSNGGNGAGGASPTRSDAEELARRRQEAEDGIAPAAESGGLTANADAGNDSGLPTSALVAIALLGLAAVGGGVYLLRDYLPPGLTSRLPGASR